jgi:hypothetical protein
VVIMARARTRRLNAAVGDALHTALSVRDYARCGDPEFALPGVSAVSVALEQARGHLADLGPGFSLEGLDLDDDISLASRLTGVLARSASFDAGKARDLHGALLTRLRDARFTASDLALALGGVPVDASGADLSALDIRRLGGLQGVTWTAGTTWPPAITAQVRAHSTQDKPGRFTVRVPCTRGPAQATP